MLYLHPLQLEPELRRVGVDGVIVVAVGREEGQVGAAHVHLDGAEARAAGGAARGARRHVGTRRHQPRGTRRRVRYWNTRNQCNSVTP